MVKDNDGNREEILKQAVDYGIIDCDEVSARVESMNRKELLDMHTNDIWPCTDGNFYTCFPLGNGKRDRARRRKKEDLEDYVAEYYRKKERKVYIEDVFEEWIESKWKYREIKRQSYDRYRTDYKRFFPKNKAICRKLIKNIDYEDLTDFVKSTICELGLTQKAYQGLRTLIKGIFKHAQAKKYTTISITQFFGDLVLPRNMFAKKVVEKENEVFLEDEIPIIIDYLKSHVNIWNMGLLLQFQTGLRIGEISALMPKDICPQYISVCKTEVKYKDDNGKWVFDIQQTAKSESGNRHAVIPDSAQWTLEQIQGLNPDGEYLFMYRGKRIVGNTFNKHLNAICKELNINPRSTHKIRKTYGSALLDGGVDESFVAEQMGHSDIATTQKHYHISNKNIGTKIEQLNKAIEF